MMKKFTKIGTNLVAVLVFFILFVLAFGQNLMNNIAFKKKAFDKKNCTK
jgi:hypothetical protein